MNEQLTEQQLVAEFKRLAQEKRDLSDALEEKSKELNEARDLLIGALTAQDKLSTATYEGLGYASLVKPAVRASFLKENEEKVFEFLQANGRGDLVKRTVHERSLSTYVREILDEGKTPPEIIGYYLQPQVWLYDERGKRLG